MSRSKMSVVALCLTLLFPVGAYAVGASADTPWPSGARVEVRLALKSTSDEEGRRQISGELVVINLSQKDLTVQDACNRGVLAFLVFDSLHVFRGHNTPCIPQYIFRGHNTHFGSLRSFMGRLPFCGVKMLTKPSLFCQY